MIGMELGCFTPLSDRYQTRPELKQARYGFLFPQTGNGDDANHANREEPGHARLRQLYPCGITYKNSSRSTRNMRHQYGKRTHACRGNRFK